MKPHRIRPLGPADIGQFRALRLRALLEEPTAFASSPEDESRLSVEAVESRLQETASQVMLGAFDGDALVGLSGLLRERRSKLVHKAWIVSFYVAPEARRRGLGRLLLERTLARARAMPGLRQVNLGVNAGNVAARRLYESMGFVAFGLERGFMLVDGVLHDELSMVHVLPDRDAGTAD
ncbi:MAG: putative acetyltransferase YhhY [Proteobacteria bacterium]|nr:putative acetyltransferase YhhY [Pseudomonadota bacterium]